MSEVGPNLLPEQLNTSEPELDPAAEEASVADVVEMTVVTPVAVADLSAGGQLAAARHQRNMSVQQVADQLKLSPRQIAAMEANQFDALPKAVIVRGFVRSYAKLLRIEAEPIIALLPQDATPAGAQVSALKPAMATPFMESRLPLLGRPDANNNKYIWGAGFLAVAAIAFFAFQKFEHTGFLKDWLPAATPSAASASSSVTSESAENAVVQPAVPATGDEQQSSVALPIATGQEAGSKIADADSAAAKPDPEKKAPEPVAPVAVSNAAVPTPVAAAPASAANALARPAAAPVPAGQLAAAPVAANVPAAVAADPANAMKLKFRQDSWIQLKRANGTVVTSHLAKAGTEETFDVKEPLQLRLGNASGVDGQLRGASMDIQGSKDSNVVNLNVK
ncbi:helix-turn-helix domain-containing protein [Undibacterium sp. TJN25]|uniref:helix-turn-helix domain-containing protein n=1 Tax=Undibacterium sp. TJN25 TaxID=3413056 RepID=UPI003BF43D07